MNEMTQTEAVPNNPFARAMSSHISAGTVAIEAERAVAEAQGKLLIAKRFPRDQAAAYSRAMDSCRRPALAEVANYKFPRGGQAVEGPSIRLAEELARCWGNIEYGIRELSRKEGVSEMEAFCWDLETNTVSSQKFTVRHLRDKRGGPEALKDERDIYEVTANMGARRLRARILAILPPDLVDAAVAECRRTVVEGGDKPMIDRIRDMTQAFARIGVTDRMLSAKLGRALDMATPDDLADLRSIYQSIRDGASSINDWFAPKDGAEPVKPASKLDAIEQSIGSSSLEASPSPAAGGAAEDDATGPAVVEAPPADLPAPIAGAGTIVEMMEEAGVPAPLRERVVAALGYIADAPTRAAVMKMTDGMRWQGLVQEVDRYPQVKAALVEAVNRKMGVGQ